MRLSKNRPPIPPGTILLEEFIQPLGVTQTDFAQHLGWTRAKLSEILKGTRQVSVASALDLADVLGTSVEFWLNLQLRVDLCHATQHRLKKPLLHEMRRAS